MRWILRLTSALLLVNIVAVGLVRINSLDAQELAFHYATHSLNGNHVTLQTLDLIDRSTQPSDLLVPTGSPIAWAPNGQKVVYLLRPDPNTPSERLVVGDFSTGDTWEIENSGWFDVVQWSGDGRYFTHVYDDLRITDTATRSTHEYTVEPTNPARWADTFPVHWYSTGDGSSCLIAATRTRDGFSLQTLDHTPCGIPFHIDVPVAAMSLDHSPDNVSILEVSANTIFVRVIQNTPEQYRNRTLIFRITIIGSYMANLQEVAVSEGDVLDVSPTGEFLHVLGNSRQIVLASDTRQIIRLHTDIGRISWSPNGNMGTFYDVHTGQRSLVELSSGIIKYESPCVHTNLDVIWSPDSRYLVFLGSPCGGDGLNRLHLVDAERSLSVNQIQRYIPNALLWPR